jgi:hypothetical protein
VIYFAQLPTGGDRQGVAPVDTAEAIDLTEPFRLLWDRLEGLRIERLPATEVDGEFTWRLPFAPAVYFLSSRSRGLLYIGKATNLRTRWALTYHVNGQILWDLCHGKLRDALELGDVSISWWELPRQYITIAESVLLQIHQPPWNTCRG